MDKLNCIEEYFSGTYANYLFWNGRYTDDIEMSKYILNDRYLLGAQVALISNMMLAIKEDLVDNVGNLVYESKLFYNMLESSIEMISSKRDDGYKVGNTVFSSAETLVSVVRNKLAHGQYVIDFDSKRIAFDYNGDEVIIPISKLKAFVVQSFRNTIKNVRVPIYERSIVYYTGKDVGTRKKGLSNLHDIKDIVNKYKGAKFQLKPLVDGQNVPKICIDILDEYIRNIRKDGVVSLSNEEYKRVCSYLKRNGCTLFYQRNKLGIENGLDNVILFANKELLGNDKLTFCQQLEIIGYEYQRRLYEEFNEFNAIASNVKNIILLDAIYKTRSIDTERISSYIGSTIGMSLKYHYDEYGAVLISMFNTLFMYGFDDVYSISGGYKVDRSEEFNFSKLDLSMINPLVINIDESPLVNARQQLDSVVKRRDEIINKIQEKKKQLRNVVGNKKVETAINEGLNKLNSALSSLLLGYVVANGEYNEIKRDYFNNRDYFKNKAIIEGIRNSIAHGHYEFISNGKIDDTIIVFSDIYEGELTFQTRISFSEFEKLIENNLDIVIDFVNEKKKISMKNVLVKK